MRIFYKWLFVIAVPLVVELTLVSALFLLLNKADKECDEQLVSHKVIEGASQIIWLSDQAELIMADFVVNNDPASMAEFEEVNQLTNSTLADMESKCRDNAPRLQNVYELQSAWKEVKQLMELIQTSDRVGLSLPRQLALYKEGRKKITALGVNMNSLISSEHRDANKSNEARYLTKIYILVCIGLGALINILLAGGLAFYLSRDITQRIDVLKENSLKLAFGQEMNEEISGTDEVADIDRAFHEVAHSLKETHERELAIFENAVDIICALDGSGRISRINQAVRTELGYAPSDVLQVHLVEYVVDDDKASLHRFLKVAQEQDGQSHQLEASMVAEDGQEKSFLWSIVWEPLQRQYFCVAHNVTERKQLERAKKDFLAMLSHDLRNPLMSMSAGFELVSSGALGTISEELDRSLQRERQSISRLVQLVNELLDLEKLESGEIDIKFVRVELAKVLSAARDAVSTSASAAGVTLNCPTTELRVVGDQERLIRVLVNLLSNAVKFSPPRGVVLLEIEELNDEVEVRVVDQGIGIPQQHLSSIFERYRQISRSDHTVKQGSGLGLAICKAIIDAHGGTIGARSQPGAGSTFWLRVKKFDLSAAAIS